MSTAAAPEPFVMPKDPLDTIMMVLAAIVAAGAYASYVGYAHIVVPAIVVLTAVAWAKAPRRSYPTAEAVSEGVSLAGKNVLITGPTSGIGTETARVLALRGAHVVLASRNLAKLESTEVDIKASCAKRGIKAQLSCLVLDLGDLASVRAAVKSFEDMKLGGLDILINNAGVMACKTRRETKQKLEAQVGTNHVGHFLLTQLLLPHLKARAPSRVVCLSSSAYRLRNKAFPYNDRLETMPYHPWEAYGNSKIANVMFANEFHERNSKAHGVSACSVMPGGIHTGLQGDVALWTKIKWAVVTPFFFKSIEQGAATTLKCALVEDLSGSGGGEYFDNCAPTTVAAKNTSRASCEKLWDITESLIANL